MGGCRISRPFLFEGSRGTGFSLWGLVLARFKGRRLKPASQSLFARGTGRRALFARGADGNVIAEFTDEAGLRRELARADIAGSFLNFPAQFFERLVVARGAHAFV